MTIASEVELLRYNEAVELPRFKASLDRLLNKKAYDFLFATHSVTAEDLPRFIDKAISEGNAVLIQREYCGYMVILWRD